MREKRESEGEEDWTMLALSDSELINLCDTITFHPGTSTRAARPENAYCFSQRN